MKRIYIVGIGTGADTLTAEAQRCIQRAEVLMGAERMLQACGRDGVPMHAAYKPDEIADIVQSGAAECYAVLVSGDVSFYSGAAALVQRLEAYDVRLVPGISSVAALCARIKLPWQDAKLISLHGAEADIISPVRRHRRTICLTGGNTADIGTRLSDVGMGYVRVYAGENLGSPEERVVSCTAAELAEQQLAPLTVLLIENENYDNRVRVGIPDDEFVRGSVPMTKAEIRAVSISRLALRSDSVCYDIGAGTGSVTVEMALSAYKGHVYALDGNAEAVELVRDNCRSFRIGNVTAIEGLAPEALDNLPAPDAVFIGGSSGRMIDIVAALVRKNPNVRIVVNAIALESVHDALAAFEAARLDDIEVAQITAARANRVAGLHMMTGMNPVTVISGGGHE